MNWFTARKQRPKAHRPYFLWSRKHQLPRQQRGIYTDLQPMQETVYWRNGKTVYRKMERTSLWHQCEMTIPNRTSFQRIWQSPGSHVPCQNFELNQRPRKPRDCQTQISRKPVDFHLQVLSTRRHRHTRIDQTGHTSLEIHITENPSISQPEFFKPSVPLTRNPLSY